MGITHHVHGVENVQAIANLALLRGMVGRPRCGIDADPRPLERARHRHDGRDAEAQRGRVRALASTQFGVELPTTPGLDTLGCMEAAARGELKFGFCLGGNLYGSNPDAHFAAEALGKLDMVVYLNTTLNTGHAHGLAKETIILPVLARDEEPQPTTQESMFNYVRLSDGGPRGTTVRRAKWKSSPTLARRRCSAPAAQSDWHTMASTGARFGRRSPRSFPAWNKLAEIDRDQTRIPYPRATLHEPQFPTPGGRAKLHVHELPELARKCRASCG